MTVVADAAPAGAEELWRDYRPMARAIVRKTPGIPAQEVDDITDEIMVRLIERDMAGMFDPDHRIVHDGKVIAARFRSFFAANVQLYVKGQRDKLGRRALHETIICDQAVSEDGTSWIDAFGGEWWDDYSELDAEEFVSRMRTWLAFQPPRSDQDRCDLIALFDELVAEARRDGKVSYAEVQQKFGIGYTTARGWVARLREVLAEGREAFIAPVSFEVAGLTLDAGQLREAITILRACESTAVRQPLSRAGHKLASPPDLRWYHQFAKEEIALYPELRKPHGTKQRHYGHVKSAVLHRLERMLGGCLPVVPEPEEPVSALDEVEAELWGAVRPGVTIERILSLADRYREAACLA